MGTRVVSVLVILSCLAIWPTARVIQSIELAGVIHVPGDYDTIQEAINAANSGDTIIVSSGVCHENVVVNKSISLLGDNQTTILVAGHACAIEILADDVVVSNFMINSSDAGICVDHCRNITISDNALNFLGFAVILVSSNDSVIRNNIIENIQWNGLAVVIDSCHNVIENNWLTNNSTSSLYAYSVGVSLDDSNENIIKDNIMSGFPTNLALSGYRNKIINNTIRDARDCGLLLHSGEGNLIERNYFYYNHGFSGIDVLASSNNYVVCNTFATFIGITFEANNTNVFYHNNFMGNKPVSTLFNSTGTIWDNGAEGNFWGNYSGVDLDGNGIGDTPYAIDVWNTDNYPLMEPYSQTKTHPVTWAGNVYNVTTDCNSTLASFHFSQLGKRVGFNVTAPSDSTATCNVTIPKALMWGDFSVLINGVPKPYAIYQNATHTSVYFIIPLKNTKQIEVLSTEVILEYPLPTIALIVIALVAVMVIARAKVLHRRLSKLLVVPRSFLNTRLVRCCRLFLFVVQSCPSRTFPVLVCMRCFSASSHIRHQSTL